MSLKIDVTESGIDRFSAEGDAEVVQRLYTAWCAHMAELRKESNDMLAARLSAGAPGAMMGSLPATRQPGAPLPFKPKS
jgi:hypothetical protein